MKDHYSYVTAYFDVLLICDKEPNSMLDEMLWLYILKWVGVPE